MRKMGINIIYVSVAQNGFGLWFGHDRGVCWCALPIKGFDMVLGNDPAGCTALADVTVGAINGAMSHTDAEDVQQRKS